MLDLPPVAPVVGWRLPTRLARDHYVRLDANDYSVHPSVIGRKADVAADLVEVTATAAGAPVARHERCWAAHPSITDPVHRQAAQALRRAAHTTPLAQMAVAQQDLADYDRIFGSGDLAVA